MLEKLKSRTEWQAFLVSVLVLFGNHFFDMGLTSEELGFIFGGSGAYGLARGLAKMAKKRLSPEDIESIASRVLALQAKPGSDE